MHNLKLIRRRFPNHANRIMLIVALISASALALGIGLLFMH